MFFQRCKNRGVMINISEMYNDNSLSCNIREGIFVFLHDFLLNKKVRERGELALNS
jgi:hypothetical protein